ncbi:MAG: hypothetical protein WCW01_00885 [Gammaproteobacteria bacterium]
MATATPVPSTGTQPTASSKVQLELAKQLKALENQRKTALEAVSSNNATQDYIRALNAYELSKQYQENLVAVTRAQESTYEFNREVDEYIKIKKQLGGTLGHGHSLTTSELQAQLGTLLAKKHIQQYADALSFLDKYPKTEAQVTAPSLEKLRNTFTELTKPGFLSSRPLGMKNIISAMGKLSADLSALSSQCLSALSDPEIRTSSKHFAHVSWLLEQLEMLRKPAEKESKGIPNNSKILKELSSLPTPEFVYTAGYTPFNPQPKTYSNVLKAYSNLRNLMSKNPAVFTDIINQFNNLATAVDTALVDPEVKNQKRRAVLMMLQGKIQDLKAKYSEVFPAKNTREAPPEALPPAVSSSASASVTTAVSVANLAVATSSAAPTVSIASSSASTSTQPIPVPQPQTPQPSGPVTLQSLTPSARTPLAFSPAVASATVIPTTTVSAITPTSTVPQAYYDFKTLVDFQLSQPLGDNGDALGKKVCSLGHVSLVDAMQYLSNIGALDRVIEVLKSKEYENVFQSEYGCQFCQVFSVQDLVNFEDLNKDLEEFRRIILIRAVSQEIDRKKEELKLPSQLPARPTLEKPLDPIDNFFNSFDYNIERSKATGDYHKWIDPLQHSSEVRNRISNLLRSLKNGEKGQVFGNTHEYSYQQLHSLVLDCNDLEKLKKMLLYLFTRRMEQVKKMINLDPAANSTDLEVILSTLGQYQELVKKEWEESGKTSTQTASGSYQQINAKLPGSSGVNTFNPGNGTVIESRQSKSVVNLQQHGHHYGHHRHHKGGVKKSLTTDGFGSSPSDSGGETPPPRRVALIQ